MRTMPTTSEALDYLEQEVEPEEAWRGAHIRDVQALLAVILDLRERVDALERRARRLEDKEYPF
jgi:polyhydroxyalkanoate synthesis regulator phasin